MINSFKGSLVWLSGAFCSPRRLPIGILMTMFTLPRRLKMLQCRPQKADLTILGIFFGIYARGCPQMPKGCMTL